MAYEANAVIEAKIEYLANNQRCMNVLHYKPDQPGVGPVNDLVASFLLVWADPAQNPILDGMRAICSNQVSFVRATAQAIHPTRYLIRGIDLAFNGQAAGPVSRQNTGLTLCKRGDLGNRHHIGSFHLGGLPDARFVLGEVSIVGFELPFASVLNGLKQKLVDGVAAVDYTPAILNKTKIVVDGKDKYIITGATVIRETEWVDTSARVMRRRTLRLGI